MANTTFSSKLILKLTLKLNTKSIQVFIALLCLSPVALAANFTGGARHANEQAAKQQAISDLQQNMYVNVESSSESKQNNSGQDEFTFTSKLSSTLPILGSATECFEAMGQFHCESSLTAKKSVALYQSAIKQNQTEIDALWSKIPQIQSAQLKYSELEKMLITLQKTQQLLLVVSLLDPKVNVASMSVSTSEINDAIQHLENTATSINMAGMLLSKNITQYKNILVKPFTPYYSTDITPFASALQAELNQRLTSVSNETSAHFVLQGTYRIADKTIQVETQLVNAKGDIIGARVVNVDKKGLGHVRYIPQDSSFEQLLLTGQIINQEFKVKVTSNKGSRDLLFHENETVTLMVKVNKPSYFYVVGHTSQASQPGSLSYLLDLNDATGKDRFIQYLGSDEVNKWVVIGEFEAAPPYGKESMQVFASTTSPVHKLPKVYFDGTYYTIEGDKKVVVAKTRGLVNKRKAKTVSGETKTLMAETVMSFTTAK